MLADLQLLPSFSAPSIFAAIISPQSPPICCCCFHQSQVPHLCHLLSTPSELQLLCLSHSQCPWTPATSLNKLWYIISSSSVIFNLKLHFYLNKEALAPLRLKVLFPFIVWCPVLSVRAPDQFLGDFPPLHIFPLHSPFNSHQLNNLSTGFFLCFCPKLPPWLGGI